MVIQIHSSLSVYLSNFNNQIILKLIYSFPFTVSFFFSKNK